MTKLLGKKVEFKKLADFETEEDYKGYVMAHIQPKMLVSFNSNTYADMKEGEIGIVQSKGTDCVTVRFLEMVSKNVDYQHLDLLTMPVKFTC